MIDQADIALVRRMSSLLGGFLLTTALLAGCGEVAGSLDADRPAVEVPTDFPPMPFPSDNVTTPEKIALGRRLFYDRRLSLDSSISCGSCHVQARGFSDSNRLSIGVDGRIGRRNAPSLANSGYARALNWEGGVPSLEQQAIVPITHPDEMAMNSDTLVARIVATPLYHTLFSAAWGDDNVTFARITKSLGAFQRSLVSGSSRFDRMRRGEKGLLNAQELRGRDLFFGETGDCFHCHGSFNFNDNDFHNNGLAATEDIGRFDVTQSRFDDGAFRTPTLRNVAVTAPYMHDGRFGTLRDVVSFYNRGGDGHPNSDPLVRPLGMNEEEIDALVAFLGTLTDDDFLRDTMHNDPW